MPVTDFVEEEIVHVLTYGLFLIGIIGPANPFVALMMVGNSLAISSTIIGLASPEISCISSRA